MHVCGELKFQEKVWILSFLCYGICMSIMRIENRREPRDFDVCMETVCVCEGHVGRGWYGSGSRMNSSLFGLLVALLWYL